MVYSSIAYAGALAAAKIPITTRLESIFFLLIFILLT